VLAYGWVFHAGFFGFYYSFGFSMWALVALCRQGRARLAAVPLFLLAITFHALPVVWALSAAVYAWAAKRIPQRAAHRILLAVAALAAIAGLRFYLTSHFVTVWQIRQLFFATGADQVWIYDAKYLKLFGCILLLAILLLYDLIARKGIAAVAGGLPFQLACLTATGVLLIPVSIQLPQYQHRLTFIADRMSLATAVCCCIMLGLGNPPKALKGALMALAAVYFFFVYSDARAANRIEDRVERVLDALPPGQRVVSAVASRGIRLDPLGHLLDRPCAGRCFNYANYEPSTGQFRLRAIAENRIVFDKYRDSYDLQKGQYTVKARDLPLYEVYACGPEQFCLRMLRLGDRVSTTFVDR
jgi:hypothetical protein